MLKNPQQTKDKIVQWIRDYFAENGPSCSAVIGISGGKDSSVAAALCVEALGRDRVVGVLMPRGVQPDISDSQLLVDTLQIPYVVVNIGEAADALERTLEGNEKLQEICGREEMAHKEQGDDGLGRHRGDGCTADAELRERADAADQQRAYNRLFHRLPGIQIGCRILKDDCNP